MIICGDNEKIIPTLAHESVDLIVTDPQYGWGFMGKDWDKALPPVAVWKECLRVLKPGAFAFVMSGPRMDCLSEMGRRLAEAGFETAFSPIFWAYASGFPKAMNMGKAAQKQADGYPQGGPDPRSPGHGKYKAGCSDDNPRGQGFGAGPGSYMRETVKTKIPKATLTDAEARALDGSYAGFQPKPSVEVVIVAMKPLEYNTYIDQALDNRKGVTWLDDCKIPYESSDDKGEQAAKNPHTVHADNQVYGDYSMCTEPWEQPKGRFPANLLASDNAVDDGRVTKSSGGAGEKSCGALGDSVYGKYDKAHGAHAGGLGDIGSFSRYFSLDAWWAEKLKDLPESVQRTFPFLVVPKAPGSEKWHLCRVCDEDLDVPGIWSNEFKSLHDRHNTHCQTCGVEFSNKDEDQKAEHKGHQIETNILMHPTQKPIKLFAYLITLGSRPGDLVVDFFGGVGTMGVAAQILSRDWLIVEIDEECCRIARRRVESVQARLF